VYLNYCDKKGIEVEMVESLFCKMTKAKIVGVTGTRGKTTTANLVYRFLKEGGVDCYLAGNIPDKCSLDLIEKINEDSVVVLELSSWQLVGFGKDKISPRWAVVTNIYEDHLDRYEMMSNYIDDKKNIFRYQKKGDVLFLNKDNEIVKKFADEAVGKVVFFSKDDVDKEVVQELNLPGEHNRENLAGAVAVAGYFKIKKKAILKVLRRFSGVPFRLEKVGEINGVSFVNDTTSTTPIATIKAVESFKDREIVLILGGNSKNLSLDKLVEVVTGNVRKVCYLKGNGTRRIREMIGREGGIEDLGLYEDMGKAVEVCFENSSKGGVVLFSCGFTSFGMFRNEFERGEAFNIAVRKLGDKNGKEIV